MLKEREVTIIYKWKPLASRPIGRPKIRWKDDVRKEWHTVKVKNWKKREMNGELWKTIVERPKTHRVLALIKNKIKSIGIKWAGHVARMGESRDVYRILVGKPK
jgi:hypothetical protein